MHNSNLSLGFKYACRYIHNFLGIEPTKSQLLGIEPESGVWLEKEALPLPTIEPESGVWLEKESLPLPTIEPESGVHSKRSIVDLKMNADI